MTPAAATRATAEATAAHVQLVTDTGAALRAQLGALGRRLRAQLPGDATRLARQLAQLRALLATETQRFGRDAAQTLARAQGAAVPLAQHLVDDPLHAGGVTLALPELTLPLLDALTAYSADLITGLAERLRAEITTQIQLATLGAQDAVATTVAIEQLLDGAASGRLSGAARAEAIVRTEVGRTHAVATQRRLTQAARQVEDVQKEWLHSGLTLHPRSGHLAAHGLRVPVDQPFYIAPEVGLAREALMHPRDPRASARSTVNCRCTSVPYVARWD